MKKGRKKEEREEASKEGRKEGRKAGRNEPRGEGRHQNAAPHINTMPNKRFQAQNAAKNIENASRVPESTVLQKYNAKCEVSAPKCCKYHCQECK